MLKTFNDTLRHWLCGFTLLFLGVASMNARAVALLPEERQVIEEVDTVCKAILAKSVALSSEPIIFRQQNVGERYHFQFQDRFSVRLDHVHPEAQQERFVAEISAPTSALRLAPLIFLGMDETCVLRQGRYLRYQGDMATTLEIFGPNLAKLGTELLNPALPVSDVAESTAPDSDKVLVAMIDSGVNYLLPGIYNSLARDHEGNALGFDFWDLDPRPFDAQAPGSPFFVQRHGTRTASVLLQESPAARLVSYRYPRPDMGRMTALIQHIDSLGVRIVGMPLGSRKQADWLAFEQAAIAHPEILFVVSAGNNGVDIDEQPVYPASMAIDNMIVVSSADDFQRPAERTNWGARSVDYLVPAEAIQALDFNGDMREVSGSSYAVSRVAALATNLLVANAAMSIDALKSGIERYSLPIGKGRYVGSGYIPDPLSHNTDLTFRFIESSSSQSSVTESGKPLGLSTSILLLDERWRTDEILSALSTAGEILGACNIAIESNVIYAADGEDRLKDLSAGTAYTVLTRFNSLRTANDKQPEVTLVFARDSKMQVSFEAEAFGAGNTASRRWLRDSLWVTFGARDLGITLAHELFHILANDGRHSSESGNLMAADTAGGNTALTEAQCEAARRFF